MKRWIVFLAVASVALAQAPPKPNPVYTLEGETIPLWQGRAPGALGDEDADRPTLTYFAAARQTSGTAVIVAPGGGYTNLAINHEGRQLANYFNAMGVSAFVLKYRHGPRYRPPI